MAINTGKIKPKKYAKMLKTHHAFHFLIFLCGVLLPPIAVALRFGLGVDLIINIFLTILGYFPSHFHNFYIQNVRNNKNKNRAPKWALKYGLVEDYTIEVKKRRAWAHRYDERLASNPYDNPDEPAVDEHGNQIVDPVNPTNPGAYIPAKIKDFAHGNLTHDYEADFANRRPDLDPYMQADDDFFAGRGDGNSSAYTHRPSNYSNKASGNADYDDLLTRRTGASSSSYRDDTHGRRDDSDSEEFYRPEHSRAGTLPGENEVGNRSRAGPLRKMMTGTKSRHSPSMGSDFNGASAYASNGPSRTDSFGSYSGSRKKKDRFAQMEENRYNSSPEARRQSTREREEQREIDPDSLDHQF